VQTQAEGDAYMEDVGGEEEEEREEEDAWIQATKFTYIMILSLLNFQECRQMIIKSMFFLYADHILLHNMILLLLYVSNSNKFNGDTSSL
jgi:hypothetical protein